MFTAKAEARIVYLIDIPVTTIVNNVWFRSRGGVLDQILDGDVPSRFQKHTHSLNQFFQTVYPTLYQFFKNITLTQLYTNFPKIECHRLHFKVKTSGEKAWKFVFTAKTESKSNIGY